MFMKMHKFSKFKRLINMNNKDLAYMDFNDDEINTLLKYFYLVR